MIRDGRMPSPEEAKRLLERECKQIPTEAVSVHRIMNAPTFLIGANDARAGRQYHRDYEHWDVRAQEGYERGRQWAALAPADVPLKRNGKLNPEATRYFGKEII